MRQMRCRVGGVRIQASDYGLNLTPGLVVDLDERLPAGGTLAEVVRAEWFEPMPADVTDETPRRRRAPVTDANIQPASPAVEESDG